ncbi:hypothetical protein QUA42_10735 [Microcoleus sp. Pol11C2]|uniref:hypothetical protein n=1 Tax=Microcoleus sp. Pol11C2 TaxID=3055389 RepID=UPI002FCFF7BE
MLDKPGICCITSVTDAEQLPPYVVADIYSRRWQIQTAFCLVKRLLGLSYLWTGSSNGIKLQIWATLLFYAVLLDVADAVADELELCTEQISLEMLGGGLYQFNHAYSRATASDPIAYFNTRENHDLMIVKYEHKSRIRQQLNLSAYPT